MHTSEGGENTFENCIPLCFDCHGDMRSYDHNHPKGTKYSQSELRRHRDNWYAKRQNSPAPHYSDSSLKLDQEVFLAIKAALPYSSAIRFLEQHDFGASFKLSELDSIHVFAEKSEDPSAEFIDADLEGMRSNLIKAIRDFGYYLSTHTWPTHNGFQSVPVEWEDRQPARHSEVVSQLNKLSTVVVSTYSILVREGRRRLGVQ